MSTDRTRGLVPFKKGHDPRRNLDGRPKEIPEIREAMVARLLEQGESGKTKFIEMVNALVDKAALGHEKSATIVINRVWKQLPQEVELAGKEGETKDLVWVIALNKPQALPEKKPRKKKGA